MAIQIDILRKNHPGHSCKFFDEKISMAFQVDFSEKISIAIHVDFRGKSAWLSMLIF